MEGEEFGLEAGREALTDLTLLWARSGCLVVPASGTLQDSPEEHF